MHFNYCFVWMFKYLFIQKNQQCFDPYIMYCIYATQRSRVRHDVGNVNIYFVGFFNREKKRRYVNI